MEIPQKNKKREPPHVSAVLLLSISPNVNAISCVEELPARLGL